MGMVAKKESTPLSDLRMAWRGTHMASGCHSMTRPLSSQRKRSGPVTEFESSRLMAIVVRIGYGSGAGRVVMLEADRGLVGNDTGRDAAPVTGSPDHCRGPQSTFCLPERSSRCLGRTRSCS